MRRITVSVDTLILRGFRGGEQHSLAGGLTRGLTRLFSDPALGARLAACGDAPTMNAGSVSMRPAAPPARIGAAVARNIAERFRT